jgi:hypothetical protein
MRAAGVQRKTRNVKRPLDALRDIFRPILFWSGLIALSCIADPWPEPDEAAPTTNGGDGYGFEDAGVPPGLEGESDTGSMEEWNDTETLDADDLFAPLHQIYCSASGPNGTVTVVGLSGSVLEYDDVLIHRRDETYSVTVGSDGGFARRILATPGDVLEVVVHLGKKKTSATLTVTESALEDGEAAFSAMGVTVEPQGSSAILHGSGFPLESDDIVIGANRTESTGRAAVVSCNEAGCQFDLLIPALSGDAIDLFLVSQGARSGDSEAYTVAVP